MKILALDLGKFKTMCCFFDTQTRKHEFLTATTDRAFLTTVLKKHKISVIAWAMLRDDKDWEPKRMIEVTESFGKMPEALKVTLQSMKPKENSDQRKSRLRKETRAANETATDDSPKKASKTTASKAKLKPKADQTSTPTTPKPRRARRPVARAVARV